MDLNSTFTANKRNCHHQHDFTMLTTNEDIDDMKFIKLVQKQEILYDRKSVHFTNETHKQHIWKDIANKFKCSAADCMAKWMMLRQRFIREKEKEIEREMKAGKLLLSKDDIKSTWKLMEAMRFMEPHVTLRIPSSMAMDLPERFTAVSKQSTHKLMGHTEEPEDETQKLKSKAQIRPDSKSGCRRHPVYEISNIQQTQLEEQEHLQHDKKLQNQMLEQETEQSKEINVLHENKQSIDLNSTNTNMFTTFLIAKQNRMKNLNDNNYKRRSNKTESVKQNQYSQQIRQEDIVINNTCQTNQSIPPQSMSLSNSAPNSLYVTSILPPIRKKSQRHETMVISPQSFSTEGCFSNTQQFVQKPAPMPPPMVKRGICAETSATQTLPLIQEEDKNVMNLTSMVAQLIDIVQNVHKTQNELLDVKRSSNNGSFNGCLQKHRYSSIPQKISNDSGASLLSNFPSLSGNGELFTSEELFGRLIASEISHLESETLINNAKLLILKIIYKLRLGENVSLQ